MISGPRHTEFAFESAIEASLLATGYVAIPGSGFDRERAIFPETALDFIRRRVSTILRQPAKEFSDFLAQSLAC